MGHSSPRRVLCRPACTSAREHRCPATTAHRLVRTADPHAASAHYCVLRPVPRTPCLAQVVLSPHRKPPPPARECPRSLVSPPLLLSKAILQDYPQASARQLHRLCRACRFSSRQCASCTLKTRLVASRVASAFSLVLGDKSSLALVCAKTASPA